jgi:carbamoylphosphate synthase large subunit
MKQAIVLGGTHDHIRLIEILKKKGYQVSLVDYNENPPAREVCDKYFRESTLDVEAVMNIAKKIHPEIVISACIDQALLTMAYVCENLNLPCHISYKTALELTNKAFMKSKFREHNIPTAKFIIQSTFHLHSIAELRFPLVVKPVDSNSSKGVTKAVTSNEMELAVSNAFSNSRTKEIIIEEYIEGEEISVDVVVNNGYPTILLITKSIKMQKSENNFTIVQSYFPALKNSSLQKKIYTLVQKIISAFKIQNSPLIVQMIHNNGKLSVIEFSARIGGGSKHFLIRELIGFDILNYLISIIFEKSHDVIVKTTNKYAIIQYLYMKPGKFTGIRGMNELIENSVIKSFFEYINPDFEISDNSSSSDRIGGYLLVSNSKENLKMLNNRINEYLIAENFGFIDILI